MQGAPPSWGARRLVSPRWSCWRPGRRLGDDRRNFKNKGRRQRNFRRPWTQFRGPGDYLVAHIRALETPGDRIHERHGDVFPGLVASRLGGASALPGGPGSGRCNCPDHRVPAQIHPDRLDLESHRQQPRGVLFVRIETRTPHDRRNGFCRRACGAGGKLAGERGLSSADPGHIEQLRIPGAAGGDAVQLRHPGRSAGDFFFRMPGCGQHPAPHDAGYGFVLGRRHPGRSGPGSGSGCNRKGDRPWSGRM